MIPTSNLDDTHTVSVRLMTTLAQMADYEAVKVYRFDDLMPDLLEIEFRKRGNEIGTAYAWYTRSGYCIGSAERKQIGKFNDSRWGVETVLIRDFDDPLRSPKQKMESVYPDTDFFTLQGGPVRDMRKRVVQIFIERQEAA